MGLLQIIAWLASEREYKECRFNMGTIADMQMDHRVRTHEDYKSDFNALDLDGWGGMPKCPSGGTYSVRVGIPSHSFTVYCSIESHNRGLQDEPSGFSPGMNAREEDES